MKRHEVIDILSAHEEELRRRFAVKSLALFGSAVRDEAAETSDVDLLVEFDRRIGLFHLIGTAQYLEEILGVGEDKVDLVIRDAVVPELQDIISGEAVNVFDAEAVEIPRSAHS
jgi:predicted nucleotidyltransferase